MTTSCRQLQLSLLVFNDEGKYINVHDCRTCPILALAMSYHNLSPSRQKKKTVPWLVLMKLPLHWNPETSQALFFFFFLI
mmetsp:Transcript_29301/g.48051  ORF Transcript_29301/g.48051 Transcript_29301/m.48051 type:complete len:80 (+) Transcript_29301:78-317(+)